MHTIDTPGVEVMFTDIEQPKSGWSLLQRSQELAQLVRFLDNVEHQQPTRQIVLTGATGTGRTAVLREMAKRIGERGLAVGSARVAGPDGLARALVAAFDEAVRTLITKRPGAPALARMQKAVNAFAESTRDGTIHPEDLANAIDRLLPALSFDHGELQWGYLVTIDDLHHADPGQVGALLEGLMAMAVTGAPVAVIVSGCDVMDVSPLVNDPANLEIVTLRTFDYAALRSILSSSGVTMVDGGVRRLEELTHGLAKDLFPLVNELVLRQGTLGAGDVEEALAVLRSDARESGSRSAKVVEQERLDDVDLIYATHGSETPTEMLSVSALMIEAALLDDFISPPEVPEAVEGMVLPFVLRPASVVDNSTVDDLTNPIVDHDGGVGETQTDAWTNPYESLFDVSPSESAIYTDDEDADLLSDASDLDDVILDDEDYDVENDDFLLGDKAGVATEKEPVPQTLVLTAVVPAHSHAHDSPYSAGHDSHRLLVEPETPVSVSGSQRRVLRTVADLRENGKVVTVDAVRRSVGDLNRFTGVSPVVTAIDELVAMSLVLRRGEDLLELSSAGVTAMLASA